MAESQGYNTEPNSSEENPEQNCMSQFLRKSVNAIKRERGKATQTEI
jgi:hypothetical protein